MAYAFDIGMRYLRSKKRSTISVITFIAITGVALGVAALLSVLSITSGFQQEFRNKVLGVNAHVLVMKYGVDFDEYRDVMERARAMPEVAGAGPFLINQMMLSHGDRPAGVLVKGVDPEGLVEVLDLPAQIIQGNLEGLRVPGAAPPEPPESRRRRGSADWTWLEEIGRRPGQGESARAETARATGVDPGAAPRNSSADAGVAAPVGPEAAPEAPAPTPAPGDLLSPEALEAALADDTLALPDDSFEAGLVEHDPDASAEAARSTAMLPGLVLGKTLARRLDIHVGDRVSLVSPLSGLGVTMSSDAPRTAVSREYRVIGIFEAGFQEYDSNLVYVDLFEAQQFYGQGDSVTGVELRLRDLTKSAAVAERLERELGGPFHTLDWEELNHNLFTALAIQKVMLSIVIATIIFVAAFNVVATLIMVVLEKKREIAILKAMGATDADVLAVFAVQGIVVGVVGTLVGLVLGGGLVFWLDRYRFPLDPKVYLIDHLPVVITPMEFVITAIVAFLICATATLAPSFWAARMLPVEGLRYE